MMILKQSLLEDIIIENAVEAGIDDPIIVEGLVRDIIGTLKAGYNKVKSKVKDISNKTEEALRNKKEKSHQRHQAELEHWQNKDQDKKQGDTVELKKTTTTPPKSSKQEKPTKKKALIKKS
jgi:Sec-independent protein translocase protein TatA